MNRVFLSARTTKEPELRYAPGSGTAVCNFTLACKRNYKNSQGEYETDFINCVSFGKTGELIANHVGKGQIIPISGRIQVRKYQKDGVNHYITEVVVEEFDWPEKRTDNSIGHEVNDDDIPFG